MTAIIFDMDDTLYEQAVPFEKACQKTFKECFKLDLRKLFVASRKHSDVSFELNRNGRMSLHDMYVYRISNAFKDFGIAISKTEALEFQKNYALEQTRISMSENMTALLQWCNDQDITLGIITNGPSEHQWNKLRCLGVLNWIAADHIFVSGDCGFSKPDNRLFELVRRKIGVSASDIWYVGDSFENDIVGANQAGWNSIWLNRWAHPYDQGICRCDIMVKNEDELIAVIHKIVAKRDSSNT